MTIEADKVLPLVCDNDKGAYDHGCYVGASRQRDADLARVMPLIEAALLAYSGLHRQLIGDAHCNVCRGVHAALRDLGLEVA